MDRFLPAATDFTDIPLRPVREGHVPCPKCHGHGRWNLLLNEYGPGKHFQQGCSQCWSWGDVKADSLDVTCLHTWTPIAPSQPWRCWHTDRCTTCGTTRDYSSDD